MYSNFSATERPSEGAALQNNDSDISGKNAEAMHVHALMGSFEELPGHSIANPPVLPKSCLGVFSFRWKRHLTRFGGSNHSDSDFHTFRDLLQRDVLVCGGATPHAGIADVNHSDKKLFSVTSWALPEFVLTSESQVRAMLGRQQVSDEIGI